MQVLVEHHDAVAHVIESNAQVRLPLADFVEQTSFLDRDDRLVGKGAHQLDLPLGERLDPFARQHDDADRLTLAQ